MTRFEINEKYMAADSGFEPITIIRRTSKCVVVKNESGVEWRMVVRYDPERKCEYVRDSAAPGNWKDAFTYYADRNAKAWGWK